jgi:hypothetical protein
MPYAPQEVKGLDDDDDDVLPQLPDILGDIIKACSRRYQHYSLLLLGLLAAVGSTNNPKDSSEFYPLPTDIQSVPGGM